MRHRSLASTLRLFIVTTFVAFGLAYASQPAVDIVTPVSFLLANSNTVAEAGFRAILANGNASDEDSATALAGLATIALRNRDLDAAASLYRRASQTTSPTNDLRGIYLTMAADALHRSSKFHEAAATYFEATRLQSSASGNAKLMAADSYERAGNIKRAEELYTEVALLDSEVLSANALLRLGMLYERTERYTDAESTYNTLQWTKISKNISKDFKDKIISGLARTQIQRRNFSSVLKTLNNIKNDPTGKFTFFKILALSGLDRRADARSEAIEYLNNYATNTVDKCSFLPEIIFWHATDNYLAGDYKKSRDVFLLITQKFPTHKASPWAMLLTGVASFKGENYSQAVEDFANFVTAHPTSALLPNARLYQAKALANLARFEDAVLIIDDLIERFHDNKLVTEATVLRGDCLFATCAAVNNFQQAANSYAAALAKIDITDDIKIRASYGLARSLFESGDSETTQKVINQLAKTHPNEAHFVRTKIFGNQSEPTRSE